MTITGTVEQNWHTVQEDVYLVQQTVKTCNILPQTYYNRCQKENAVLPNSYDVAEKLFWEEAKSTTKRIYAADQWASLFDIGCDYWNFTKVNPFLLGILQRGSIFSFQGVTTPFVYFGAKNTCFPWHTEDMVLNTYYLFYSKPYLLYSI